MRLLSRCGLVQAAQFAVGLIAGLMLAEYIMPVEWSEDACASEVPVNAAVVMENDEFTPERVSGGSGPAAAAAAAGRSVQRPRYYSTELGMRARLVAGVLTSAAALDTRGAAINATVAGAALPLRLFMAARGPQAPPRAGVVGFTDTREMLKPFHALKYLADNYLEEYDLFFLTSDLMYVNARRLQELTSRLSVSQDVYMGTPAEEDSQYCSLDDGILLSNSVLRLVQGSLDWCVRNSYSAHHHENLGRCVLHVAHTPCQHYLQGEQYTSAHVDLHSSSAEQQHVGLRWSLRGAVTAGPVRDHWDVYKIHAYVSRLYLERDQSEIQQLSADMSSARSLYPPAPPEPLAPPAPPSRWPAGVRADPEGTPPVPINRFDHLRWTWFNSTHALMPDDHRAVAPLAGSYRLAVEAIVSEVLSWVSARLDKSSARVSWGAWRWSPPAALEYRLLLHVTHADTDTESVRLMSASRVLGATRLVPVRYVTESARVAVVVYVTSHRRTEDRTDVLALLARMKNCQRDNKTRLILVLPLSVSADGSVQAAVSEVRAACPELRVHVAEAGGAAGKGPLQLAASAPALRGALLFFTPVEIEFNEDFLNRVRMNTISGVQWFSPEPFSRYAIYGHPAFHENVNTGRFHADRPAELLAVYSDDLMDALSKFSPPADAHWPTEVAYMSAAMTLSPLHAIRAADPAALRPAPPSPPCRVPPGVAPGDDPPGGGECLRALREGGFAELELGARHSLAKLLLHSLDDVEKGI